MDQPGLEPDTHRQALRGLARLNWASRASGSLWRRVHRLIRCSPSDRPLRLLDVACGGGDISRGVARHARRAGVALEVHGLDFSETAIGYASSLTQQGETVAFAVADALSDELPADFDIVTCSLFLHHLTEAQSVELLVRMTEAARLGVVISDLRRSWLGYALAAVACRTLSRAPVVAVDGPRSVEGAYTIEEFRSLARAAKITQPTVRPVWPQRFIASWRSNPA